MIYWSSDLRSDCISARRWPPGAETRTRHGISWPGFKELPSVDQSGSFFRDVPMRIESEIALSEGRPDDALALLETLTLDSSTNFGQLAFHAFGTSGSLHEGGTPVRGRSV